MFFYLITWAFYSDLVLAASLPRPSESVDSLAAGPVSSLNLLSPANTLALSSNNSSPGNVLKIACDATKYGKNLKVNSCRNVFRFLRRDETRYTFAERDSGVPHDVPLPLRTLSSKTPHRRLDLLDTAPSYLACKYHPSYSDVAGDGLCFVQPILKKDAISGYATSTEIGQAAFTMLQTCVIERGMGGMAFNIGECFKRSRGHEVCNASLHCLEARLECARAWIIWILTSFF